MHARQYYKILVQFQDELKSHFDSYISIITTVLTCSLLAIKILLMFVIPTLLAIKLLLMFAIPLLYLQWPPRI